MTDIVERLRERHGSQYPMPGGPTLFTEASDEIERLRGALRDAREDVAHWGGYAPQWAQNKHDLAGDLARIDAAIAAEPYQNDYQNDEEKGRPARWSEPPEV